VHVGIVRHEPCRLLPVPHGQASLLIRKREACFDDQLPNLDLRLRFEIEREFAPYIGVRYGLLVGETASIADSAGIDTDRVSLIFGVRFAF